MAHSKVAPLELFTVSYYIFPSRLPRNEAKTKTNNIQKTRPFFSVCVHLMSYGKIFFHLYPGFLTPQT